MSRIDFRDPVQSLAALEKLMGELDPTREAFSWFGGHGFAIMREHRPKPPRAG